MPSKYVYVIKLVYFYISELLCIKYNCRIQYVNNADKAFRYLTKNLLKA